MGAAADDDDDGGGGAMLLEARGLSWLAPAAAATLVAKGFGIAGDAKRSATWFATTTAT